ncbi:MAG: nitroreductase family deazaflavin-dependent oxidoreductase [Acidimicrobiia bacterium]|nr:nitroreductase family deazaflavin-dependent oxidoreductase [Acidimicrobiia bacterium]
MTVAITGATGFVGSHTVVRLLAHGHRPRLLVRNPAKAARVLGALGVDMTRLELIEGDMVDAQAVARLLDGADAVIHAAAAVAVTGTRADGSAQNVVGGEVVLGGAAERGLDPVIHVSSVAVFIPPDGSVITADSALASPRTAYGRAKLSVERFARGLQEEGAPVTTVYPGGVVGSHQPTHDSMMEGLAGALSAVWPMPRSGVALIHVEDLAEALARMVVVGQGPRRLMLGGDFLTWTDLADLCDELTGVACRRVVVPDWLMMGLGALFDVAHRIGCSRYPLTRDGAEIMVSMVPTDDSDTETLLDLTRVSVRDSVEEALRWLAAEGYLAPHHAGRLAPAGSPPARPSRWRWWQAWLARRVVHPIASSAAFARIGPRIFPPLDRAVHKVTGGRILTSQLFVDSLVLRTTGRRSGEGRDAPLACASEPGGTWLVVGSNFGKEHHPAWTANLLANPVARVTRHGTSVAVVARLLTDDEREEAWARLRDVWPIYDRYEDRSGRSLRVFRLTPS